MKKNNKKKGSFFSLLLKNYIAFTAVNVILVMSIFYMGTLALTAHLKLPVDDISSQAKLLEAGHYEKIKPYKIVGSTGYFEILDENNKRVFVSDDKIKDEPYTEEELACIQDYTSSFFIDVQYYIDEDGGHATVISANTYIEEDKPEEYFMVLDKDKKVTLSSPNVIKKQYTQREYEFLTDSRENGLSVSKYPFTRNDKKTYTMIINTSFANESVVDAYYRGLVGIGIGIIFCYILSILAFVFWLAKRVNKPLKSLNDAMVAFAEGDREKEADYSGAAEFVQICDSFNNMAELLRESESAKTEVEKQKQKMLADISHDLKTPITTILGYTKALNDGMIPYEEQKKYLDKIYKKSVILTQLINTFYEYSKLEHPDFTFVFENTEINEIIREYLAGRYEEIIDDGFELELDIPEKTAYCDIDRVQILRAFENILNNSLKHNPAGTIIYVKASEDGENIRIMFADSGVGINEDMAKTVFEAFVVGDESRSTKQGSGLGLSISKKIIEGHGGTIRLMENFESLYNTAFEILIPMSRMTKTKVI